MTGVADAGQGDPLAAEIEYVRASGLFQPDWYAATYPDIAAARVDPLVHFCQRGWQEGRRPNPYFDPAWYLAQNPALRDGGFNPLLHYIRDGEHAGGRPVLYFDPAWYRETHGLARAEMALAHFLAGRQGGQLSPIPEFDAAWYTSTYPDVAAAGIDPFEHYLVQGFREGRNPSPGFDTRFYRDRYLRGTEDQNPLIHYLLHRHEPGIYPMRPEQETTVAREVRRNTRPGPHFEAVRPLPLSAERRALVLAYYLPQFHRVEENDRWWGDGFTEWTNISRGQPRFPGHYQPRVPRDLGHYDLSDPGVMRRQIELARGGGIGGFVFYFYWFNGSRLLEKPVEAFLADPSLDFPFCLMWANENWTRRWDGSEDEVLISQDYREQDEPALIATFVRHFRDARYIRLDGRPLLVIYRPRLIPDTPATIARWRAAFRAAGEDPIFVMAQSFGESDPRPLGLDGAIEFPPHKLVSTLPTRNAELFYLDPDFTAHVHAYEDVVRASLDEPAPDFPLIKTAVPGWDNDARRQGAGLVVHDATPDKYQDWLVALIRRARAHPFMGEPIVCINAWNEWAEGAYLEPDLHFGAAFLNATGRAVSGLGAADAGKLLLVGHDAFLAGAQLLLLAMGRQLRAAHGIEVVFLLLGGGQLERDYAAVAPVTVAPDATAQARFLDECLARGFRAAIVNTSAAAPICAALAARGIEATLLVHELPRILREKKLIEGAIQGTAAAERVVFACSFVRDRFTELVSLKPGRTAILPQGVYRTIEFSPEARATLRARLHVAQDATLAIGAGYADLRKGFDLFLQAWRAARQRDPRTHFVWLGAADPNMREYLGAEIDAAIATGHFHMPGHREDVGEFLSAADVFALTSREDPFPSVALEAMQAGLPIVAFAESGGIPDMLAQYHAGAIVGLGDATAMAEAILTQARTTPNMRDRLAGIARAHFAFDRYTADLLRLARPGMAQISAVVPNYNYARYLRERMGSIFAQTHPVEEVIVLDDASTDGSLDAVRDVADEWRRAVRVIASDRNSGSVFRQWRRAAEEARGEFLWIAEADDAAEPEFLAALAERLARAPDAVLAFTDSRAIDQDGAPVWPSYKEYYRQSGADTLAADAVFGTGEFLRRFLSERNLILNVSAVLWRRQALLAAFARCGDELSRFRMAGDWRLYVEVLLGSAGSVVYCAQPLNIHRRHASSVTHSLDAERHVQEIARMHALVGARADAIPALAARQSSYVKQVGRQLRGMDRRSARGHK